MSSLVEKAIVILIAGGFWYMFFGSHIWLLFNAPSLLPMLLVAPIALILVVTKVIELPWRN